MFEMARAAPTVAPVNASEWVGVEGSSVIRRKVAEWETPVTAPGA
jgi:hypothetical protein